MRRPTCRTPQLIAGGAVNSYWSIVADLERGGITRVRICLPRSNGAYASQDAWGTFVVTRAGEADVYVFAEGMERSNAKASAACFDARDTRNSV